MFNLVACTIKVKKGLRKKDGGERERERERERTERGSTIENILLA
jgi:hypothetical protein